MKTNDFVIKKGLQRFRSRLTRNVRYYRKKALFHKCTYHDYPAVIVGCKYKQFRKYGWSAESNLTQFNRRNNLNLHCQIENAVNIVYAKRNKKNGPWFNRTCAEDHAASMCLFSCEQENIRTPRKLSKLEFTVAIRPRTGEEIKYCNTCKAVFGL